MKFKYHKDGTLPENGEFFVFGSNLAGIHGAGAAKVAKEKFGAICAQGITGHAYAIPTKDLYIVSLQLDAILTEVLNFTSFSRKYTDYNFFVTAIGCGLAGYKPEDIAPMFRFCNPRSCSFPDTWLPYLEFSVGLDNIENIIFDNCDDIENYFCGGNELISYSFNSESFKVVYLLMSGQHVTNSFSMTEFNGWMKNLLEVKNEH